MADSGFGNISLPGKAAAQNALGRGGHLIQIISVPNQLNNVAKTLRLAGEITHLSKASIIRISTSEGEIQAQIKSNKPLQPGQKIEIEVPPGRPPRQATLRTPASPTPTVPISSDSTSVTCVFLGSNILDNAAAVIQPAEPPPKITIDFNG